MIPRLVRPASAVILALVCAAAVPGADVVLLKDGFVVQGNPRKETTQIVDKSSGAVFSVVKGGSWDMIDEGPKVTAFSVHARQPGGVGPDTKLRPDVKGYQQKFAGFKSSYDLPAGPVIKIGEFNSRWVRTLTLDVAFSPPVPVEQQIIHMDPYWMLIYSPTHKWRLTFRTAEWDPKDIRKLLMMHPDLAEPDGKCDPGKRVMLAKFLLDAGWLQFAKAEVERLKRDFTAELPKDVKEEHDKLLKAIDQNTAERYAREAELSLAAGRYQYTRDLLKEFPEKTAGAKEVTQVAKVNADLKTGQERYDKARRFLRANIDAVRGMDAVNARAAVAGGLAIASWVPPKGVTGQALDLATAAEQVLSELHQDSASRIETFVEMAGQAERARLQGGEPTKKPEQLLAVAVSGWAMGKSQATTEIDAAWKFWSAREAVLAYQRGETAGERTAVLGRYKKNLITDPLVLAQIISLLPPAVPENLEERTGKPVALGNLKDACIYRYTTQPAPGHAAGLDYLVKLPPEYHHGRAYPVLLVLPSPGVKPEEFFAPLIAEADRYGYILVVPERDGQFGKGHEWKGEEHVYVTAALRDTVRRFTVDNDKVFLLGVGDGANLAMDVGMSHPDLFAGVIPMCPVPKWSGVFMYYWQNAQKLPFYTVTGEMSGDGLANLKRIYDNWMPTGYPSMLSIYKGRGIEWYAAETPVFFDWMSRKTRASAVSTLPVPNDPRNSSKPWVSQRETDNHFYWLQVDGLARTALQRPDGSNYPANISGDIRNRNEVRVRTRAVTKVTIWLSNEMIEWSEPLSVILNDNVVHKKKKLEPDVGVLLEDYYQRGDRRMLFLNKLEFTANS